MPDIERPQKASRLIFPAADAVPCPKLQDYAKVARLVREDLRAQYEFSSQRRKASAIRGPQIFEMDYPTCWEWSKGVVGQMRLCNVPITFRL